MALHLLALFLGHLLASGGGILQPPLSSLRVGNNHLQIAQHFVDCRVSGRSLSR